MREDSISSAAGSGVVISVAVGIVVSVIAGIVTPVPAVAFRIVTVFLAFPVNLPVASGSDRDFQIVRDAI